MLVIRLFRTGKKNQPSFKIIVTDKRNAPTKGRFVEEVGFTSPLTKERILKAERIKHWISVGAKPSPTVYNMLVTAGIVEGSKIPKHKKSKKQAEEQAPSPEVPPALEASEQKPEEKES
ncbi:MAG: 30S ribosomal protein S16 [Candidatus Yanofskybacteria bacterium]|nr:30S ribosomal protein S16 [Candidatus Yanofskybacteria bacterium]